MRAPILRILLFLAGLLAVAALGILLTPPIYRLLDAWGLATEDDFFVKVLRRLLLIPTVLYVFLLLRPWRDGGPASYGLLGARARPRAGLLAFAATVGVGVALLAWHFAEGWLRWEQPIEASRVVRRAGRWILVAPLVAVIEEWFFRGWLDRRFRAHMGPVLAAVLVALIFAPLHAFKPSHLDVPVSHDVAGALEALGVWLGHLVDLRAFGPAFLGLFLLSLLLTALYRRSGSLWPAIGAHAGGVFVIRSYGALTDRHPQRTWAGTKELYDGPVTWALLVVLIVWLWPRGGGAAERGEEAGEEGTEAADAEAGGRGAAGG